MQTVFPFLLGMLLGIAVAWLLLWVAHRRTLESFQSDGHYEPTRRAVVRHFHLHGTLNLKQLEQMMDIGGTTALRYLDQMVEEGLLQQQGHRGADAFYTLK